MIKKCSKCKQEKSIDEFSFKIKRLSLRHRQCKKCTRLLIKKHYNENRQYYLTKAQKRNSRLMEEMTTYIKQYLSKNHCVDCGESSMSVLEFDHRGEIPKLKAVSSLMRLRVPLKIIIEEINKCEVRCANCHRKKTAKRFKWYKVNNALVA